MSILEEHADHHSNSREQHAIAWLNHVAACCFLEFEWWSACSSKMFIIALFGIVSSSFQSFCSSITYNIKITCKNSQNSDKNITKY